MLKSQRPTPHHTHSVVTATVAAAILLACADGAPDVATRPARARTEPACRMTLTGPAGSRVTLSGDNLVGTKRRDAPTLAIAFAPLEFAPGIDAAGQVVSATYALTVGHSPLVAPVEVTIPYDSAQVAPGTRVRLVRSDLARNSAWSVVERAKLHDGWMTAETRESSLYRVITTAP